MHNVLPARGAQVRDALLWSQTIDEAIGLFSNGAEVHINCHNWPVWGRENVALYLKEQRDIYKYTHEQALHLANLGHTPNEIAVLIEEPDWLSTKFHARGYYGSLKFNARAVYQYYYGFFDGHPVNIDPLAPEALATRFVDAVGGADAAQVIAEKAVASDDLQWAATVLNHVVFAGKADDVTRKLLAEVYRHQGYRAESGIIRNYYLCAAAELIEGVRPLPMAGGRNADLAATLSLTDWFNAMAMRLNPERARGVNIVLNFQVGDRTASVSINRQVEFVREGVLADGADATLTLTRSQLEALGAGQKSVENLLSEGIDIRGEAGLIADWLALHDTFDLWFDIVTP